MSADVKNELIYLMYRFAAEFRGARVGQGPQHPTNPQPQLRYEINRFLRKYSFLRRDAGYVAFLKTYAGASAHNPNVDIAGFHLGLSLHLTKDEGDVVENGFLLFASLFNPLRERPSGRPKHEDMDFSFDATGERAPGIYCHTTREATSPELSDGSGLIIDSRWFCEDFLTWLRLLLETRGHLYGDLPATRTDVGEA